MIKKIKKYLYLINSAKIEFNNPLHKEIVVFDNTSIDDLKNILSKRKYFTLGARFDGISKIYISLRILYFFFKNYNHNILSSYLIALIKVIKPKIVLTTIDNSWKFHEIAKSLRKEKINFLAIQNAARYDLEENNLLFKKKLIKKNPNSNFFIPQFICYGDYVENEYRKNKIKVGQYYNFGSLRLSNYLKYIKEKKIKLRKNFYDVSFISGYSFDKDKIYNESGIDYAWAKMCAYTIRFCIKNKLKFLFIAKARKESKKKKELDFFKKYLSEDEFIYLKNNFLSTNRNKYTPYKAIHETNVLTGVVSTMLQDKLALDGKILVCNFTNYKTWDFPIKNFCFLRKPSLENFQQRLGIILKLSNKKYLSYLKNKKLIYFNKQKSTIQLINQHLDKLINIK
jgi:surface carbohydrate biosynthesis protein